MKYWLTGLIALLLLSPVSWSQSVEEDLEERGVSERYYYHVHLELGKRALERHQREKAVYHFTEAKNWAITFDPPEHFAYENLGDCFKRIQNYKQAVWAYSQAFIILAERANPGNEVIRERLRKKQLELAPLLDQGPPQRPSSLAPKPGAPGSENGSDPGSNGTDSPEDGQPADINPEDPTPQEGPPPGIPPAPKKPVVNVAQKEDLTMALSEFRTLYNNLRTEIAAHEEGQERDSTAWRQQVNAIHKKFGFDQPFGADANPLYVPRARMFSIYGELIALSMSDWDDSDSIERSMQFLDELFTQVERDLNAQTDQ
jgi:hypothetical protein